MVRHVLAIYRDTAAGREVLSRASAIANEHGAELTVAVISGRPSRPGGCAVSGARWDAIMREEAQQELRHARSLLDATAAEFALIQGDGRRAIRAAAEDRACDLVLLPGSRLRRGGRLARTLRQWRRAGRPHAHAG
jgi:nucleotide-binding universal stress UspA family protein